MSIHDLKKKLSNKFHEHRKFPFYVLKTCRKSFVCKLRISKFKLIIHVDSIIFSITCFRGEFNGKISPSQAQMFPQCKVRETKGKVFFHFLLFLLGPKSQVVTRRKSTESECSNNKLSNDAESDDAVFRKLFSSLRKQPTHKNIPQKTLKLFMIRCCTRGRNFFVHVAQRRKLVNSRFILEKGRKI